MTQKYKIIADVDSLYLLGVNTPLSGLVGDVLGEDRGGSGVHLAVKYTDRYGEILTDVVTLPKKFLTEVREDEK
jgi:hypothetical protein